MAMNNKTMRPQATAVARTLYFFPSVDNDWNNLGNWYFTSAHVLPQPTTLPAAIDDVFIDGHCTTNSGGPITVNSLTVGIVPAVSATLSVTMTVTGLSTFTVGSIYQGDNYTSRTLTTGSFSFLDTSQLRTDGVVIGSGSFSDYSYNYYGTITGDCVFSGFSYSSFGTITGDCTFSGTSYSNYNSGTITGDCTFSGNSYSNGTITGDCTFDGTAGNSGGTITGDCTFAGASYNDGTITGDCTFAGASYNADEIIGDCTFNGSSYNDSSVTGDCTFNDSSENTSNATVTGDATLNDTSLQNGTVTGTTTDNR